MRVVDIDGSFGAIRADAARAGDVGRRSRIAGPGFCCRAAIGTARLRQATAALSAVLAMATPALADCLDWSAPDVVAEEGAFRGLPPGTVRWRIGRAAAGGSHLQTLAEIRWRGADGRERRQVLFGEMQDGRAYLTARGGRLRLHVTHCPRDQACHEVALAFAWDRAAGQFAGASPAARDSLAAACQPAGAPGVPAQTDRPAR